MKIRSCLLALPLLLAASLPAAETASRKASTVVLDATGVKNLRIQTAVVEPGDFEETIFALGRIDVFPDNRAVVSSRIAGRALEVLLKHDHPIKQGDLAVVIESRQIGDPPPRISLTAPISGLVSAVSVVPGEPVNPDRTLAEIVDLTKVYALARVPEHIAGKLKIGQLTHVTVPAAGSAVFSAVIEHLGVVADPESGTVEAALYLDNPDLALRPGMRAEFSIVIEKRTDVTSVPRSALQGDPASRFVYVKDFDLPNAFVKTPVVIGQSNDRSVEIVSGLLPADEVVTQGAYSLAFAGAGNLSLKEALDAAHGHEHNADGSELSSDAKKNSGNAAPSPGDPHDHSHEKPSPFWMIVSAVLFILLIIVGFKRKSGPPSSSPEKT